MASTATAPAGDTWYWVEAWPESHTVLPAIDMQVKVWLPLPEATRSPIRPPQPNCAPSVRVGLPGRLLVVVREQLGRQRRRAGGAAAPASPAATSGPTLAITAARPALKWPANEASSGGSASGGLPASTRERHQGRAVARDRQPRIAVGRMRRRVVRDHGVGAVVAAEQEHAHHAPCSRRPIAPRRRRPRRGSARTARRRRGPRVGRRRRGRRAGRRCRSSSWAAHFSTRNSVEAIANSTARRARFSR